MLWKCGADLYSQWSFSVTIWLPERRSATLMLFTQKNEAETWTSDSPSIKEMTDCVISMVI